VFAGVTITKDLGDGNNTTDSDNSDFDNIANAFDRMGLGSDDNSDSILCPEAPSSPSIERAVPPSVTVTTTTAVTLDGNPTEPGMPMAQAPVNAATSSSAGGLDVVTEGAGRRGRGKKAAGTVAQGGTRATRATRAKGNRAGGKETEA
jgi:hypothetical protein